MKLSAALLCEELGGLISLHRPGEGHKRLCLGRPEFSTSSSGTRRGRLCIVQNPELPAGTASEPDSCLICIGKPPDGLLAGNASVLFAPEETDIFTLFNSVQQLYDTYDDWDGKLRRCISSRRDMQSIIDVSGTIFKNPLCFVDASFRIAAMSDYARRGREGSDLIPEDAVELFRSDSSHGDVLMDRGDLIVQRFSMEGKKVLSAALKSHQKFVVGILLIEHHTSIRDCDVALISHMADYVLTLFEYNAAMKKSSTLSLVTVFVRLLDQQTVMQADLSSALSVFDWKISHSYEVYYLKLPAPEFDYNYLTYQGRQIEKQLPSALAIAYGGDIVVIHNITRSKESAEQTAKLHSFLRSRDLSYGKSRAFHNISELKNHYAQAMYALNYGQTIYPAKIFHRFSDCCLEFMVEHCCDTQAPESLFPSGLSELIEHDRDHGTQYLKTLIAFCEKKFNATHTADALHIHRTTLIERIKRIRELVDTDFENPSERLHLLLALELIKSKGKY